MYVGQGSKAPQLAVQAGSADSRSGPLVCQSHYCGFRQVVNAKKLRLLKISTDESEIMLNAALDSLTH